MSTRRDGGYLEFICDLCGVGEEGNGDGDFKMAWEGLKDEGWRAFKNHEGDWEHRCPDCVGKDR